MKDLFAEILEIGDVEGVMLLSPEGKPVFQQFSDKISRAVKKTDWRPFVQVLEQTREMELMFEDRLLYIRKSAAGYVIILMGLFASTSMVRLNCDALMPALEKKAPKGLGRFFRRK